MTTVASSRTTYREDLGTIAFSLWMIVGLFVDAYFHSTDPGLESFWTPWHGLFYSGFAVTGAWVGLLAYRRRGPTGTLLDWAPPGYRLALIGLGIFAAGGVGDAIWHSTLGIETGIDALLSPTHLLLFVGMLLIVSAPLRAAWGDTTADRAPRFSTFFPTLLSLTLVVSLVAFFLVYAWLPANDEIARSAFVAETNRGEQFVVLGIATLLLTTIVLMPGLLLSRCRWRLPFGSATFLLTFVTLFLVVGFDESPVGLPAMVLAGVFADGVMANPRIPKWVLAAGTPLVMWSVYFYRVGQLPGGLGWPPEIWAGGIVFAMLASLAIDALPGILPGEE